MTPNEPNLVDILEYPKSQVKDVLHGMVLLLLHQILYTAQRRFFHRRSFPTHRPPISAGGGVVFHQFAGHRKVFVAPCTLVRRDLGVREQVQLERAAVLEGQVATGAGEGFLLGVGAHVDPELATGRRLQATH